MKLGSMFSDVVPSLFRAPATERYPFERRAAPERLRGLVAWQRETCTGCGMCATDCPSQAIELVVFDKKTRSIVLVLHVDRCTFCGQCTYSCKQGCLTLEHDQWELAALDRKGLTIRFGQPADVQDVMAGITARPAVPPPGETPRPSVPDSGEGRGEGPPVEGDRG